MTYPISKKFAIMFVTAMYISLPVNTALADDTEVYLGGNAGNSSVKPNVLFIIDTSGSMGTTETFTNGSYDPATTYTGSCDTNRIYWSDRGNPPTCSTDNYITRTANKCDDSAAALTSGGTGFYVGRLARYRIRNGEDRWSTLSSSSHTEVVECEEDYGVHGDGADAGKLYPADQNDGGPWRATASNAIRWRSEGDDYTLYTANYLNWFNSPGVSTSATRLEIVQDTFAALLNSTSGINAGLMRFSTNAEGGYFLEPMQEINSTTRSTFIATVNGLNASGNTPLSETLYESALYWRSQAVDFGDSSTPATNNTGVLDPDDSSKYKTPMAYQCQKNFVVLLTDGAPTSDTDADTKIRSLPDFSAVTGSSTCSGNCLDELADWTHTKDLNSDLNDKQNVTTFTIGFQTDQTLLQDTATKGGGEYHTAESATDLSNAFTSILTDILSINTTFVAPAVTVNAFNRLTHRDELYFAVFRPTSSSLWPGNIKHYKLKGTPKIVVDANDAAAVDANTGFFSGTSRSFWTLDADAPDGDNVALGGTAGMLTTSRNVYTYTGATAPSSVDLTASENVLHEDNTDLTKALLNIAAETDAYRTNLVKWSRGIDILDEDEDGLTNDARRSMGDALHGKPVLMTYGGDDANPDITLFAGTNDGFIHAIDTSDGSEEFAFIPKELLGNLNIGYQDLSAVEHPYGMDGSISLWHKDANNNGVVLDSGNLVETGEHVYLYAGMRRGGNHYYALDVTNRSAPKLLWQIDGGSGDFAELGQTWSRPIVTKIKLYNGTSLIERNVLIFGGGYDTDQDGAEIPQTDDIGRAIYMVDATTGQRLWWASSDATANTVLANMTNSIPSDVKVIDIDVDGFADRIYVGDMGGRIWRLDIDNATNTGAGNLVKGGILASLGGATEAQNHRFYYPPDVALIKTSTGYALTVSIGSGYRAHPLEVDNQDRFYMIRDTDVFAPPADANTDGIPDYPAYTEANLYDATDNDLGEASGATLTTAQNLFNSSNGWYIKLAKSDGTFEGEKVLASSITVEDKILFTTFTPVTNAQSTSCAPSQGTAKTYVVNLVDATPALDLNKDGSLDSSDRSLYLVRGGIPPEPTVLFPPDGSDPIVLVGPEKLEDVDIKVSLEKTFWRQDE